MAPVFIGVKDGTGFYSTWRILVVVVVMEGTKRTRLGATRRGLGGLEGLRHGKFRQGRLRHGGLRHDERKDWGA